MTDGAANSPKTGTGRHELPTELETPLPAALYLNLKSVRRRICGHGAQRGANRTPSASLSAAAPPSNSGRGFQRGGPQPAPLCRFKGVRGEIEIPPRFSLGGRGGHSLFKREYPPGFSVPNRYSSAGNPGNLFGKTKRKWGFNPVRHSRTSPYQSGAFDVSKENVGCILRGKAALPAANRRLSTDRPGSAAYSCTGDRPAPGSTRRWEWRGCGCPPPPRSGW